MNFSTRKSLGTLIKTTALLLTALYLFSSCADPLSSSTSKSAGTSATTGSLIIRLTDGTDSVANTIYPDLDNASASIDSYLITLSREGYNDISSSTGGSSALIGNLAPGTWNVGIDALNAEGTVIARGSGDANVVAGVSGNVSIELAFLEGEGSGTITLTLAFPAGSVASVIGTLDGEPVTFTLTEGDENGIAHATLNIDKPAGAYSLVAKLKDSANRILTTLVEQVHVFGNITVADEISIDAAEINGPPLAPSAVTAAQNGMNAEISWTDNSNVETSLEIQRSSDSGSTWSTLSSSLNANTVFYTDSGVVENFSYRYRVRAANSFGASDWAESSDLDISSLISLTDDTLSASEWNFYEGIATTIPLANLTSNDLNNLNTDPIEIISVDNAVNGSVSLGASSITFTGATASQAAGFTYTARIQGTSYEASATVTIETVEAAPGIIANSDGPFDVQQGGETYLTFAQLLLNDSSDNAIGDKWFVTGSAVNCSVVVSGTTLTVTSTGIAYVPAQFKYEIEDSLGQTAEGTVYLNVTPLAPVDGYVFDDSSAFNTFKANYTPMSFADVFNNWPRISGTYYGSSSYYETLSGYSDSALSWQYLETDADGDGDLDPRVLQPDNVSPAEGFVCPEESALENFTFEATLFSDNADNDSIGLIMAFERDGSTNKYLVAHRTTSGNSPTTGWGISYYEGSSYTVLAQSSTDETGADYGWESKKTRVKVQRIGDLIKAWITDWDQLDTYMPDSLMEIDLSANTVNGVSVAKDLSVFQGAQQWGYYTYSQPYSTYLDIEMSGGLSGDTLFLLTGSADTDGDSILDRWTGSEVWKYVSGAWTAQGSLSIQSELGYVRQVTNPETAKTYLIKASQTELVE